MCCPLLPPSPFPASPLHRLRPSFLFRPVPWPLGIEPVAQELGFGDYVGRPPECGELSGPQWLGPALQVSTSPLMGKVRPPLLLSRPVFPLLPPPLCFVLRWGRGVRRSWGFPPISCISPRTKGMRACSGGAPPSLSSWGPAPLSPPPPCTMYASGACCSGGLLRALVGFWVPPPPLHAVRWERTLLGGCPLLSLVSPGAPLLLLGHAVRWEPTLPYGGSPPSSGLIPPAVPSLSWLRGFPPSWSGMPCDGSACFRTRRSPSLPWLCPRAMGARGPSPTTSCLRAVCARG